MGTHEREWAHAIGFVGLFKVKWQPPCQKLLVEFLNTKKENKILFYLLELETRQ
jgi:hypothetical protein